MNKGDVLPVNEWLYRRGYSTPEKRFCNPDGTATSRVFKPREKDGGQLSVDMKSMTSAEKAVKDKNTYFLFEIKNQSVEDAGFITIYDPIDDGSNDAHSLIIGLRMDDELGPALLARRSRRVYF